MVSLSKEAERMLREMTKEAPLYNRVGALSIVAEDAVRTLYKKWKTNKRRQIPDKLPAPSNDPIVKADCEGEHLST